MHSELTAKRVECGLIGVSCRIWPVKLRYLVASERDLWAGVVSDMWAEAALQNDRLCLVV